MRFQESDECVVKFFGVREVAAVWAILDDMQLAALDRFMRSCPADFDGDNLITIAMNHKRWDIKFLQVSTKVCS